MLPENWLKDRTLLIATKHHKESVIGPILKNAFGIEYSVPKNFDTDILGTFTGEINRLDDPLTTVRKKCRLAMKAEGSDICIASEGSFGPHPTLFFTNADEEWMVLIDKKHNYEIIERYITPETNFGGKLIHDEEELICFASKYGFPDHGLILRKDKNSRESIEKGIRSWELLIATFHKMREGNKAVYVETDMRAHQNPTRMNAISTLTNQLVLKMKSLCPACTAPGFGNQRVIPGLPCGLCGSATQTAYSVLITCPICQYETETKFPNGKQKEDPMYCEHCNP